MAMPYCNCHVGTQTLQGSYSRHYLFAVVIYFSSEQAPPLARFISGTSLMTTK